MIDLLTKGGVLIIPILFCSVLALAIFLERLIRLYQAQRQDHHLIEKVYVAIIQGNIDQARKETSQERSSVAKILDEGLSVCCNDRETIESVLSHAIEHELRRLSRYFGTLATIANITPVMGLLGTVLGMIKAFMAIERLGGKVDASVLAGGIWEAMLTTAVGLSVALPAMVAYSYLRGQLAELQAEMEEAAVLFLKALKERGRDAAG
ncbi:MotA/TolQ/ExbB proton channel family protein [Thermosulfuriphilus sp.]